METVTANELLNLTAVNGAYTSDPEKDNKAERIDRMTSEELVDLVSSTERKAGSHSVMDPLASRIIARSGIPTFILNGRDLESLRSCLSEKPFDGTVIDVERR